LALLQPSNPTLFPRHTGKKTNKERQLAKLRVEGGGGGAKSNDGEKGWSSINYSILSGFIIGNVMNTCHLPHFNSLLQEQPLPAFFDSVIPYSM
jgi:hypothetical protein